MPRRPVSAASPTADAAPPAGRRERSKRDKRRRILDAAAALFAEKGYEATTTREIAAREVGARLAIRANGRRALECPGLEAAVRGQIGQWRLPLAVRARTLLVRHLLPRMQGRTLAQLNAHGL